jgi:hypothetical protein
VQVRTIVETPFFFVGFVLGLLLVAGAYVIAHAYSGFHAAIKLYDPELAAIVAPNGGRL